MPGVLPTDVLYKIFDDRYNFNYRGEWDNSVNYAPGDVVDYGEFTYRAQKPNVGAIPVNGVTWALRVDMPSMEGVVALSESASVSAAEAAGYADLASISAATTAAIVADQQEALDSFGLRVGAVEVGQSSSLVAYATQSLLFADLAYPEKTAGLVTNDPLPANNGTYRKIGASGAGSWEQSSFDRIAIVEQDLAPMKGVVSKETGTSSLLLMTDSADVPFFEVRADGGVFISGLDQSVQSTVADLEETAPVLDATTDLFRVEDAAGNVALTLTADGALVVGKVVETAPSQTPPHALLYEHMDARLAVGSAENTAFTIFDSVADGAPVFRAPVLVRITATVYLAICERRDSTDDFARMDIVCRRITYDPAANSVTLGAITVIAQGVAGDPALSKINPCAIYIRSGAHAGRVVVWYLSRYTDNTDVKFMRQYSDDQGTTWSVAEDQTAATPADRRYCMAPGPGKAIQLKGGAHAGRIIIPLWTADSTYPGSTLSAKSALLYSDDGGDTITYGAVSPIPRSSECYPVESLAGGEVILYQRLDGLDYRKGLSYSKDGGTTFYRHESSDSGAVGIESVLCQHSIINPSYDVKTAVPKFLFSAPIGEGLTRSRTHLHLWSSYDGVNFNHKFEVTAGVAAYSDIEVFTQDRYGVLYESTANYSTITLNIINLTASF